MLAGDATHPLEDLAMTAVNAVEIPQGEYRVLPARRA